MSQALTKPRLTLVPKPSLEPRRHYALLDGLRAGAAFWAFAAHTAMLDYFPLGPVRDLLRWGMHGIELFFVLSGFLIGRLMLDEWKRTGALDVPRFWARRWLRTFPAYYVALLLLRLSVLPDTHGEWSSGWSYVFYLQNYFAPRPGRFDWSWSLCVEEHFYLTVPLLVWVGRRFLPRVSPERLFVGLGLGGMLVALIARIPGTEGAARYSTHANLSGLFIGVLVAGLPYGRWTEGKRAGRWVLAGLVAVTAMYLVRKHWNEPFLRVAYPFLISAGFGMVLLGCLGNPFGWQRPMPAVRYLSDITYSFFLYQVPVLYFFWYFHRQTSLWIVWGVALALAAFLRFAVEKPFLRLREKYFPSR